MVGYKVRLYDRGGNCIGEVFTDSLKDAEQIRLQHGASIGLVPMRDFSHYPTIWKSENGRWTRVRGY